MKEFNFSILFIRDEISINEIRTPLTPYDVKSLINLGGYKVYVESSQKRIYSDKDYESNGAIITKKKWYDFGYSSDSNNKILIIGLKSIDGEYKYLDNHHHLYFSHTFKNQSDSKFILTEFKKYNSFIYDFEYFTTFHNIENENENMNNIIEKRLLSFGFYAGIVGGFLGVLQIYHSFFNRQIMELKPWYCIDDMLNEINYFYDEFSIYKYKKFNKELHIGIIGAHGRCALGVCYILNKLGISYTQIDRNFDKNKFVDFDLFYNCILLDGESNEVFFDENTCFYKKICIIDISCDIKAPNNPIKLYKGFNDNNIKECTWGNPVLYYGQYCSIIAISNLPSLLPKDSSDYFSKKCYELLLGLKNNNNLIKDSWNRAFLYFQKEINKINV
jgi:saccharopine dehydrogenase (NAD+, L-lysine-forming)